MLPHSLRLISRSHVRSFASAARQPRTVFSGIQPTGTPHLGNYLGALSNWVELQRNSAPEDTLIFSIVGWHALTMPQDPATLRASRLDMLAVLLAIGLDPKRCTIFHQDENPDHVELGWILNCLTSLGRLKRMTTWKSKLATSRDTDDESEIGESQLNAGLLTYPVLQAADILAYRATHVPVGDDQRQHLELCRDLADLFNRTYKPSSTSSPLFPLPETLITTARRILSLKDPNSKMSKSAPDPASRILLTDTYDQIRKKLRGAVTDNDPIISYDPVSRPGTSNLLTILGACTGQDAQSCVPAESGHGKLKERVAEAIEAQIGGPRKEYLRLRKDVGYLDEVAKSGATKARERSSQTLQQVRRMVGLA